jgi:hypothetical protein
MKAGVTRKLSVIVLFGLALGLAFALGRACAPSAERKDWISLSRVFFGTRTNAGLVIPTVNVIVSNVGPQKILFASGWFECRTKSDGAWLGAGQRQADPDPMHGPNIFLSSGSSVRMHGFGVWKGDRRMGPGVIDESGIQSKSRSWNVMTRRCGIFLGRSRSGVQS